MQRRMVVQWDEVRQRRLSADRSHPRLRRSATEYRRARLMLVPGWVCVVVVAALAPWPATLISTLLATFVSFAFLDEREQ